jgi:hypothetical protein
MSISSGKGRGGCIALLAAVVLLAFGWCHYTPFNRFEPAALAAIRDDAQAVIYALDPMGGIDENRGFHGYDILGQATIEDEAQRREIADRLAEATHGAWDEASCFMPRHGLRAQGRDGVFDFVICFECGKTFVYHSGGDFKNVRIWASPDFLNKCLRDRGIELPNR